MNQKADRYCIMRDDDVRLIRAVVKRLLFALEHGFTPDEHDRLGLTSSLPLLEEAEKTEVDRNGYHIRWRVAPGVVCSIHPHVTPECPECRRIHAIAPVELKRPQRLSLLGWLKLKVFGD